MSSDVQALSCAGCSQDLENASVTAQRDRSRCPHAPESADARTLAHALLAWGWVKSRVFGDFHVEWEWHGLQKDKDAYLLLYSVSNSQLMRVRSNYNVIVFNPPLAVKVS